MRKDYFMLLVITTILQGLFSQTAIAQQEEVLVQFTDVHPDEDSRLLPLDVGNVAGVTETGCHAIGLARTASGTSRYRGNIYHFDTPTTLLSVEMQFAFTGTLDLYISVHQKQMDGTFDRYAGWPANDIKITAVGAGAGNFQFYGTGQIPGGGVQLVPGDYAIGFAWISPSPSYGDDSLTYPRNFTRGQVLGLVSANGVTVPVADDLGTLLAFTGGAYSMRLCFDPLPGACCSAAFVEGCRDVVPSECNGADATFHGERTTCADTPCRFGACCSKCGLCNSELTPQACAQRGGVHHWPGATCPINSEDLRLLCPRVTGACCRSDGTCFELCADECTAIGGTYRGDGTDCTTNICKGACCIANLGCFDKTQSDCLGVQGSYRGDGTSCITTDCRGACCITQGATSNCLPNSTKEACDFDDFGPPPTNQAVFRGDMTTCPASGQVCRPAVIGACCLPNGTCINTISSTCASSGGTFTQQPVECTATSCTVRACCFSDGDCQLLTQAGCTTFGGLWNSEQLSCDPNFCDFVIPTGACCGGSANTCTTKTNAQCDAEGGVYRGDGTLCSTAGICPGFGACCEFDGHCLEDASEHYCDLIRGGSGAYQGNGSTCQGVEAVDCRNQGACCTTTQQGCIEVNQEECLEVGGEFLGVNISCDLCTALGACCTPDGVCTDDVPRSECQDPLDQFHEGFSCASVGCVGRGACCTTTGQCQIRSRGQCTESVGFYAGDGVQCIDDICAIGACCNHLQPICVSASRAECESVGDDYGGAGVSCQDILCGKGACCELGNPECRQLTQMECFDLGGTTFSGFGVPCKVDTCLVGACCIPAGDSYTCSQRTHQACDAAGGVYRGQGTTCSPGQCNLCSQQIVSSTPPDCDIDPRRPFDPTTGAPLETRNTMTINFACNTVGLTPADLVVTSPPTGAPGILSVNPSGTMAGIVFDRSIPPGEFTCVRHIESQTQVCIGSLPGDVDANRGVTALDIGNSLGTPGTSLLDHFLGNITLPVSRCDLDRTGVCTPLDLITGMDLLNGAALFTPWLDETLPQCPLLLP